MSKCINAHLYCYYMLKPRGLTLIGSLISLSRGEEQGTMILFVIEACKGGLAVALLLSCKPPSIPAVGV
jgi:hypothetical protein